MVALSRFESAITTGASSIHRAWTCLESCPSIDRTHDHSTTLKAAHITSRHYPLWCQVLARHHVSYRGTKIAMLVKNGHVAGAWRTSVSSNVEQNRQQNLTERLQFQLTLTWDACRSGRSPRFATQRLELAARSPCSEVTDEAADQLTLTIPAADAWSSMSSAGASRPYPAASPVHQHHKRCGSVVSRRSRYKVDTK